VAWNHSIQETSEMHSAVTFLNYELAK